LPSATAQNVTGKQNSTGSYKLVADGATSVSRLLTSSGFGTVLAVTTKTAHDIDKTNGHHRLYVALPSERQACHCIAVVLQF